MLDHRVNKRLSETHMMASKGKTKLRLYLDLGLLVSFVLINMPLFTGIAFHEWASFVFIPVIILHVLMDWNWIINVTRRMFKKLPSDTRFNHIWDYLLFALMTTAIVSGLVISQKALPVFGIPINNDPFWFVVHNLSTTLLMVTIGIH